MSPLSAWRLARGALPPSRLLSRRPASTLAASVGRVAERAPSATAVLCSARGTAHTYAELASDAAALRRRLRVSPGGAVAYLLPSSYAYAATTLAIWQGGGVAVPLCVSSAAPELRHVIGDSGAALVVADPALRALLGDEADLGAEVVWLSCEDALHGGEEEVGSGQRGALPPHEEDEEEAESSSAALIIYTSGTTGPPKGVVHTHTSLLAQAAGLRSAWEWEPADLILNPLPMHHLHGFTNVFLCALLSGATVDMQPSFSALETWRRIAAAVGDERRPTMFFAVPTIYVKLMKEFDAADADTQAKWSESAGQMRLMISGSAALPEPVSARWEAISGVRLLERYGMTEIGMALSNSYGGERVLGHVGLPLPGVEVRIVSDADGSPIPHSADGERGDSAAGQLQVRGPSVFREYWNLPEVTAKEFTADGWFKTGDVATVDFSTLNGQEAQPCYRILGRSSVDILKSGGYKLSALDIERDCLEHSSISEIAVLGVADEEWGQRVMAVVELAEDTTLTLGELREWAKPRMAVYKVPSLLEVVDNIPRNVCIRIPAVHSLSNPCC